MKLNMNGELHVKSAPPDYALEASDRKPNTVRLVDENEYAMCTQAHTIVVHGTGGESFGRGLSGVFDITGGMKAGGFNLPKGWHGVMLCWEAS